MEAAFFYGMQEALALSDFSKLGGWTYTSSNPSPLDVMKLRQSKRQLENKCFECGMSSHYAGSPLCRGPNLDCFYKCLQCKAINNVSSRGQSTLEAVAATTTTTAAPKAQAKAAAAAAATAASTAPAATAATVSPQASQALASSQTLGSASARSGARSRTPAPAPAPRSSAASAAPAQAVLRRPAGAKFQREVSLLTFEECWEHSTVRKVGRYRCCKDVLAVMDTVKAGSAMGTVAERVATIARQKSWPPGSWDRFSQFRGHKGAGRHGVGCTKRAMKDLYLKQGGKPDE